MQKGPFVRGRRVLEARAADNSARSVANGRVVAPRTCAPVKDFGAATQVVGRSYAKPLLILDALRKAPLVSRFQLLRR